MEKNCLIFCAASFDGLAEPIQPGDLILAADGGLRHTRLLGLQPDWILGDFDSLGEIPTGGRVRRYPVMKDDTDSMLALRFGLKQGFRRFLLYGAMDGPRLDHTVANFQALHFLAVRGACGYLIGRDTVASVISGGALEFPAGAEGIVSVFCLGGQARGVTLRGLLYPLEDSCLQPEIPLGVSNHFTGMPAVLEVRDGALLVLWERRNGLPRYRACCKNLAREDASHAEETETDAQSAAGASGTDAGGAN